MTDREKVIRLIEEEISVCESVNQCYRTIDLPALRDILAVLKEQEAVKPKCKERMGGFVAGLCPTCGTALNNVLNVKACGKCGQAVKWE